MVSSFTALALAPGALNTGMPRFEHSSMGILFTPLPARPTASTSFRNWHVMQIEGTQEDSVWMGAFRCDRILFARQPAQAVRRNFVIG